jgi:hypothetical protein
MPIIITIMIMMIIEPLSNAIETVWGRLPLVCYAISIGIRLVFYDGTVTELGLLDPGLTEAELAVPAPERM